MHNAYMDMNKQVIGEEMLKKKICMWDTNEIYIWDVGVYIIYISYII